VGHGLDGGHTYITLHFAELEAFIETGLGYESPYVLLDEKQR
jgi:hypothetical protein